jgi:hypothetical protein
VASHDGHSHFHHTWSQIGHIFEGEITEIWSIWSRYPSHESREMLQGITQASQSLFETSFSEMLSREKRVRERNCRMRHQPKEKKRSRETAWDRGSVREQSLIKNVSRETRGLPPNKINCWELFLFWDRGLKTVTHGYCDYVWWLLQLPTCLRACSKKNAALRPK